MIIIACWTGFSGYNSNKCDYSVNLKVVDIQDQALFETSHGSDAFPFNIWLNLTSDIFVYCNYHKDIEIIYIQEGKASFGINGTMYEASAGQALIINSEYIHTGRPVKGTFCSAYAIVFDLGMLAARHPGLCQDKYIAPFINNELRFPGFISGEHPWEAEILDALSDIIDIFDNKTYGYELKIIARLYTILSEIISNRKYIVSEPDRCGNPVKLVQLKKALKYIQENYSGKIQISELAREANISRDHFYKIFKSMTGKTPVEYITVCRIRKACHLLKTSEMSILETALAVGMEDVSFFIKTFKKFMGVTPKRYRRSQK